MSDQANGRPSPRVPAIRKLLLLLTGLIGLGECGATGHINEVVALAPGWFRGYVVARNAALEHPLGAAAVALAVLAVVLLAIRAAMVLWHNQLVPRLSGTYLVRPSARFPLKAVDLQQHLRERPADSLFVGETPKTLGFLRRWRPVRVSLRQRAMHTHVIGKTGSGKTLSVLWPQTLQDILDGRGVLVMDGKGSDENLLTLQAMAERAGRLEQFRVFSLLAWGQPGFSHTYNLLHVRPRGPKDPGGDVIAMADRVLSVLTLGGDPYYDSQAQLFFQRVCRILHGIVDEEGRGIPFTARDVVAILNGLADSDSPWGEVRQHAFQTSLDQEAVAEAEAQLDALGNSAPQVFTGLTAALEQFRSPLVNAYQPGIAFEEVLHQGLIVYVQLPSNLYPLQARALGRVMLRDLQQQAAYRQVRRGQQSQGMFCVTIDEFASFADLVVVDGLNKLRDANIAYTIAHQSMADLELVSKEFAQAVWDNTRTKHILRQDSPELCERVARSLGTEQVEELTVRHEQGALFTSLSTGDASKKLVEAYRLHPNAIKSLAEAGQGYCVCDDLVLPVNYPQLPPMRPSASLPALEQGPSVGLHLFERALAQRMALRNAHLSSSREPESGERPLGRARSSEALIARPPSASHNRPESRSAPGPVRGRPKR